MVIVTWCDGAATTTVLLLFVTVVMVAMVAMVAMFVVKVGCGYGGGDCCLHCLHFANPGLLWEIGIESNSCVSCLLG